MGKEIERKFLVRRDLWFAIHKPAGVEIIQGYLLDSAEKIIRLRIYGKLAYLTIKGPTIGISRSEFEYSIPLEDGLEMMQLFISRKIEKVRYKTEFEGKTWEIDEFFGVHEGLIIAEIELNSADEKFDIPPWLGDEVTSDPRYFNSWLCGNQKVPS
ncbi:MAG: CYTH domain-containing protein [Bacteroidota bacterium]